MAVEVVDISPKCEQAGPGHSAFPNKKRFIRARVRVESKIVGQESRENLKRGRKVLPNDYVT